MTTLKTTHHEGSYIHSSKKADLDSHLAFLVGNIVCFNPLSEFWSQNLSSPASGNTVRTAGTSAIGGNASKIAYFSDSTRTAAHSARCAPFSSTPCVTFRLVVAPLRGPGQSPVLPSACCVRSLLSVGRCGRCSCWCRFRVRGALSLVCWGCAGCGMACRLRVSGAQ